MHMIQMYTNLVHSNDLVILFYFMNFLIIGNRRLTLQHRLRDHSKDLQFPPLSYGKKCVHNSSTTLEEIRV